MSDMEKSAEDFKNGHDCGVKAGFADGIRAAIAEVEKRREENLKARKANGKETVVSGSIRFVLEDNAILVRLRALLPAEPANPTREEQGNG